MENNFYFEWDDDKNELNKRKHKIAFETALHVFDDPNRLERYDGEHSDYEDRYISIGLVDDVLFVVHTERRNRIRLISARIASKKERDNYYGQIDSF